MCTKHSLVYPFNSTFECGYGVVLNISTHVFVGMCAAAGCGLCTCTCTGLYLGRTLVHGLAIVVSYRECVPRTQLSIVPDGGEGMFVQLYSLLMVPIAGCSTNKLHEHTTLSTATWSGSAFPPAFL